MFRWFFLDSKKCENPPQNDGVCVEKFSHTTFQDFSMMLGFICLYGGWYMIPDRRIGSFGDVLSDIMTFK